MSKHAITTDNAPAAIGPYSQAIRVNNTVYLSGQIPLRPDSMTLVADGIDAQITQVLDNLSAVAVAAGGDLNQAVKLTVYLTDLENFAVVNQIMANYFQPPYPARAAMEVTALPKGAAVEIDAILQLD